MFVSKTPYRISFVGGGTDLPQWVAQHGGMVISTTIDKYCYITCRKLLPFFPYKHRLVYSQTETVSCASQIQHPGMRGVFEFLKVEQNLEIHHDGDLPARSGLGSSSSFTVGLLNVIQALSGKIVNPGELARDAIFVEQQINKEIVGAQDQVAASHGGFNKILFLQDGNYQVTPIPISSSDLCDLNDHLLLFYSGIQRRAPEIESTKIENLEQKVNQFTRIMELAIDAEKILVSESFNPLHLGQLLHEGWQLKRSLSDKVSNQHIDEIYAAGLGAGAIGGKILGAGGGGFVMFLAEPNRHEAIRKALSRLVAVEFKFENKGSEVYRLQ